MYTLESLRPLNASFDSEHKLEQSDVDIVNCCVKLIESTRGQAPCPGDNIEYTDEYGNYSEKTHIIAIDDETGRLSIRICPHVPCVCNKGDENELCFYPTGGGLRTSVDSDALSYIGKREKMFMAFGHCGVTGNGTVYFSALVNVWEYIAPGQKKPDNTISSDAACQVVIPKGEN